MRKIIPLLIVFCILFAGNAGARPAADPQQKSILQNLDSSVRTQDREFLERHQVFMDEVKRQTGNTLDDRTRLMSNLASLLGCQGRDLWPYVVQEALDHGVNPLEIKEIIYQAVPYLGLARVYPFLVATNGVFRAKKIRLPLAPQATTTGEDRLQKGNAAQITIFGETMKDFTTQGPADTRHINIWLAENCFGDYYTRDVLSLKQREMITFCYLAAQGGCEPQLTAHAAGNLRMGNGKGFLIGVISANIPYIGYPRSLNAINCVRKACQQQEKKAMHDVDFGIWPKGEPNTAYAKYFIGNSYLAELDTKNGGPINVTFEPGCRNNWHIHHKSVQVLICVAGRGWYQAFGEKAVEMKPGTVIAIPAGVKHWHGAARDSWFQHITYMTKVEDGASNEWLEPVTDDVYNALP